MADVQLSFLLMGKTGHGKSKTGNFLLGRAKAFKASSSTTSQTKEVMDGFAKFDKYLLAVVDGPGLEDTDIARGADREKSVANMTTALGLCDGGVDAFLFVTKFGCRFTEEERSALEALKRIFGKDYMKHVIVIMTGGDLFEQAMEDEDCNITFDEWCREQRGAFRQLYNDCNGRVVLVNNFERDEKMKHAQRLKIIQFTVNLKKLNGVYTSKSFQDAKDARDRMIVEQKAPELGKKFQAKASLLAAAIEQLPKNPHDRQRELISRQIQDLRREIIKEDMRTGVLKNWMKHVDQIERNLHDVVELGRLAAELETIRQRRKETSYVPTIVMAALTPVCPPLIAGAIVTGIKTSKTRKELDEQETRNLSEQEKVNRRLRQK